MKYAIDRLIIAVVTSVFYSSHQYYNGHSGQTHAYSFQHVSPVYSSRTPHRALKSHSSIARDRCCSSRMGGGRLDATTVEPTRRRWCSTSSRSGLLLWTAEYQPSVCCHSTFLPPLNCLVDDKNKDDDDDLTRIINTSAENKKKRSKSTFSFDEEKSCLYHRGFEQRKKRLHDALSKIGVQPEDFVDRPEFQGTAALRAYTSFIFPKSEGALAMTQQPQRATVIANHIAFLVQEHRSNEETWLRNHDRALEEVQKKEGGGGMLAERHPIVLVLDNVRSAHNVGNILRAAEAAKCDLVLLCGSMTPAPPHPKVLKTALGAAEYVPYRKVGSTLQAIQELKEQGVKVIGVETTSKSIPLWDCSFFEWNQTVAFVFGNEMIGVDTKCLRECDEIIALPTHGIKNSLNVATCVSVVLWEALRQWDVQCQQNRVQGS